MAIKIPLSDWMVKQPEYTVAVDRTATYDTRAFVERCGHWVNFFSCMQGSRWAVYHEDACECLAIIFALWQLGKTACVPGDNCQGTIDRLQSSVDGFAGQFSERSSCPESVKEARGVNWKPVDKHYDALEIYTSGSTGEPKPISKSLRQLENELEAIEKLWGSEQAGVVISTVSHQHFYGMVFRLFWPVSMQRAFETHLCSCSEDIFHHALKHESFHLVSSPTHLSRLNPEMKWQQINDRCTRVISSAAPLSRHDSFKSFDLLDTDIFEIYGSSETGAVAWRCQQLSDTEALWECLPGVEPSLGDKKNLLVKSDYQKESTFFELSDLVELAADRQFKLLGRLDRIVKVEGKRVSLNAIEEILKTCRFVEQAKVLILEKRNRVETAAVLQLSDDGWSTFRRDGRKPLIKEYKAALSVHLEAVVIPRRWRFVECLPCNQQGKISIEKLKAMFEKKSNRWPVITDVEVSECELKLSCYAQEELVYFDGHFEGNPILPGVVQVHWAQEFARHYLGIDLSFKKMEVIKFQQVIPPYRPLELSLKFDAEKKKIHFRYESERGVHSSGRICFE